jgi:transposase
VGSHFTIMGRLSDAFMESGLSGLVKSFRDGPASAEAFACEDKAVGIMNQSIEDGICEGVIWLGQRVITLKKRCVDVASTGGHRGLLKIRIVLSGLRGEDSIAELCRKEGIAQSLYYSWSKEFLEAGKKRLAGDTARQANTGEVKDLRAEALALKELVADLSLENRLLKKNMSGAGGDGE